jgi:thioredoxin 2
MQLVCPSCYTVNRVPRTRLAEGPVCGKCRSPLMPREPTVLDQRSFDRYVGPSDLPVLVDFWASWCAPCRMLAPVLEEVARRRSDVRVAKIDTDAEPALATRFGIRSIPTMVLMLRGREVARLSGAVSAGALMDWLNKSIPEVPAGESP